MFGGSEHEVAEEALVRAGVVEGYIVLEGDLVDGVSDVVDDLLLEEALIDVEHLFEVALDVEA